MIWAAQVSWIPRVTDKVKHVFVLIPVSAQRGLMPIILLSPFNWEMKFEELPPGTLHVEVWPIHCLYYKSSAHTHLFTSFLPKRREEEQNYAGVYVLTSIKIQKKFTVFCFYLWITSMRTLSEKLAVTVAVLWYSTIHVTDFVFLFYNLYFLPLLLIVIEENDVYRNKEARLLLEPHCTKAEHLW